MTNKERYEEDGFIIVKEALSPVELEEARAASGAVVERVKDAKESSSFLWSGSFINEDERKKLDINGVHDVQFHSAVFSRLLLNAPVLDVVTELIGPNVQLHHTKLIVK